MIPGLREVLQSPTFSHFQVSTNQADNDASCHQIGLIAAHYHGGVPADHEIKFCVVPETAAAVLIRATDLLLPVVSASFGRHIPEADAIKAFNQAVTERLVVSCISGPIMSIQGQDVQAPGDRVWAMNASADASVHSHFDKCIQSHQTSYK